MGGFQHLVVRPTSDQIKGLVVGAALAVCLTGYFSPAKAQAPPIQVNPTIAPTTQTTSAIAGTSIFFSQQPLAGDTSALAQATGVAPGSNGATIISASRRRAAIRLRSALAWAMAAYSHFGTLHPYDHNIYSSSTNPFRRRDLIFVPTLRADFNTGIYMTSLIRQHRQHDLSDAQSFERHLQSAGRIYAEYSPLRDLVFTVQGNSSTPQMPMP